MLLLRVGMMRHLIGVDSRFALCSRLNQSGQERLFPSNSNTCLLWEAAPRCLDTAIPATWPAAPSSWEDLLFPLLWDTARVSGVMSTGLQLSQPLFPSFCPLYFHPNFQFQILFYHGPLTRVTSPFLPQLPTTSFPN